MLDRVLLQNPETRAAAELADWLVKLGSKILVSLKAALS